MKTRQEILKDYLDKAEENLIHLEITTKYLQKKYGEEDKKTHVEGELAKITAEQRATEDWISFIKEELNK